MPDDFGRAAGARRDDRRFERHCLEDGIRRAFVVRGLDEQIERMMKHGDVGPIAEQLTCVPEVQLTRLFAKLLEAAARAGDDQLKARIPGPERRRCLQEQVEPLLRLDSSHGAHDEIGLGDREFAAGLRLEGPIASEGRVIDPVQHDANVVRTGATVDQLASGVARHRNYRGKQAQDALVERVIQPPLADAVSRPAVDGRQRNDRLESGQQPGEQIGLVVVGVHDVDFTLANQPAESREDRPVQRMRFDEFHVVDGELGRLRIHAEYRIAPVSQIAYRYVEAPGVGTGRP